MLDNGVVDFDEFVQEVVDKSGFRMEPRMLKMYLEATMEPMISGVLSDGRTRRMGDYFPDANMQKRSIRTFFKEFHDKYPDADINKYFSPAMKLVSGLHEKGGLAAEIISGAR